MTGPISLSLAFYRFNSAYRKLSDIVIGKIFEPDKDIVLITGGASGLGKELVQQFIKRHTAKIVVLDLSVPVQEEEDAVNNVMYYKCDISNCEDLLRVSERIKAEVGVVSILINNAGIAKGKLLVDMSFEDIEQTIKVNLLSNFYTIKAFLPGMIANNSGYIVTVASVLGYLSPAKLSAYGASKSGLIALHESLTYELGPPSMSPFGVKTLLICPGQLKTKMFAGVTTPSSLFAPELEPSYVAKCVVRAIELGRRGEIKLPFYGNIMPMMRSLPWPLVEMLRGMSGMDSSMKKFVGRITPRQSSKSSPRASSLIS